MKHAVVKCLCAVVILASLSGLGGCKGADAADGGGGEGGSEAGNGGGSAGNAGEGSAGMTAAGSGAGASGTGAAGAAGSNAGSGGGNDDDAGVSDPDGSVPIETGVTVQAIATCEDQCDVQDGVVGCEPVLKVGTCKTVCTSLSGDTPSDCSAEFKAFYDCSVADGFRCLLGVVAQKTSACNDEHDELDKCRNGGVEPMCEGELPNGRCPSVACACTSGTVHVAGFKTGIDGCTCYDTETCKAFWCDE